jgi:hypothetical protein
MRRTVPIRRSTNEVCHGDPGEIGRSRMPMAITRDLKTGAGQDHPRDCPMGRQNARSQDHRCRHCLTDPAICAGNAL